MKGIEEKKIQFIVLFCMSIIVLSGCQTSMVEQGITVNTENEYSGQNCDTEFANGFNEKRNKDVNLRYIPELGYRDTMMGCIEGFNEYVCWKDILIIGNNVYAKENEGYRKKNTVSAWLGLEDEWEYGIRQYNNMLITPMEDNKGFFIFNLDTEEKREYICEEDGSFIVWWYVFDGKIYYDKRYYEAEKNHQGGICTIDILNGEKKEVYSRDDLWENREIFKFKLRENGDMIVEICERENNDGRSYISNREYWLVTYDEGKVTERKIWETDELQYEYWLDFNSRGLFVMGDFYQWNEFGEKEYVINLTDDGEVIEANQYQSLGSFYFTEDGYYVESSMKSTKELEEKRADYDIRYLVDAVSKYDYEGNRTGIYRLVEESILEEGWYLLELLCVQNEVTAFYVNDDTDELYVSQIYIE